MRFNKGFTRVVAVALAVIMLLGLVVTALIILIGG